MKMVRRGQLSLFLIVLAMTCGYLKSEQEDSLEDDSTVPCNRFNPKSTADCQFKVALCDSVAWMLHDGKEGLMTAILNCAQIKGIALDKVKAAQLFTVNKSISPSAIVNASVPDPKNASEINNCALLAKNLVTGDGLMDKLGITSKFQDIFFWDDLLMPTIADAIETCAQTMAFNLPTFSDCLSKQCIENGPGLVELYLGPTETDSDDKRMIEFLDQLNALQVKFSI